MLDMHAIGVVDARKGMSCAEGFAGTQSVKWDEQGWNERI